MFGYSVADLFVPACLLIISAILSIGAGAVLTYGRRMSGRDKFVRTFAGAALLVFSVAYFLFALETLTNILANLLQS